MAEYITAADAKNVGKPVEVKQDFIVVVEYKNSNPNGDPDAGNMPRMDRETEHGIVTDVCFKRKGRNYIELLKQDNPPYKIFIKEVLNPKLEEAYAKDVTKGMSDNEKAAAGQAFMCRNYYDVRAFGAVMSTGKCKCGVVRGPIQISFGESVEPIEVCEHTVTRQAITDIKDEAKEQTMGKKYTIPYGLYVFKGHVSAPLAKKTGFTEEDLELFWETVLKMFDNDYSAARGEMAVRKLIIFKHDTFLGNESAHKLFERVKIERDDLAKPARCFSDYTITIDENNMPNGVEVIVKD